MNKEVATLSNAAADIVLGKPAATLEAGALAGITRRTEGALEVIGQRLGGFTRAELLVEIDRTMAALEAYPTTPDLPDVELYLALPEWSEL